MKELTLKAWSAMLPNDTKFQSYMDVPFEEMERNPTWTLDCVNRMFGDYCLLTKENSDAYPIGTCKPILYDLSWLTRYIKHEGETFVPLNEICNLELYGYGDLRNMVNNENFYLMDALPVQSFNQLLEWKFNVFSLPDELIVKVSETFNPYK